MSEKTVLVTLAVLGFVITFGLSFFSGGAMLDGLFLGVAVPVMSLGALVAGYVCPPRTWSYGCAVTGGAWAAKFGIAGGSFWVFLPPALLYAVAIALICGGAAKLGGFLERRSAS